MQDFNEYAKNQTSKPEGMDDGLFNLVNNIASKFDGKNQNELLMAIYKEAQKGKRNGTLSNACFRLCSTIKNGLFSKR